MLYDTRSPLRHIMHHAVGVITCRVSCVICHMPYLVPRISHCTDMHPSGAPPVELEPVESRIPFKNDSKDRFEKKTIARFE